MINRLGTAFVDWLEYTSLQGRMCLPVRVVVEIVGLVLGLWMWLRGRGS